MQQPDHRHARSTVAPSGSGKSRPDSQVLPFLRAALQVAQRSVGRDHSPQPRVTADSPAKDTELNKSGAASQSRAERGNICAAFFFFLSLGVPCTRAGSCWGLSVGRMLPDPRKTSGFLLLPPVLGADVTVPENLLVHE